jgi:hypothetical protein
MANTLKELREMSDEQLIIEHDNLANRTQVGLNYYLDELNRREQNKQTEAMLSYTRRMLWFTVTVTILTVINVIAVLVPY